MVACATTGLSTCLAGLINGTGPGLNPGQGTKLCRANSGMYAIGFVGTEQSVDDEDDTNSCKVCTVQCCAGTESLLLLALTAQYAGADIVMTLSWCMLWVCVYCVNMIKRKPLIGVT